MNKLQINRWVVFGIGFIIGCFIGIAIYQLYTISEEYIEPTGNYTCNGGLIKYCYEKERRVRYGRFRTNR